MWERKEIIQFYNKPHKQGIFQALLMGLDTVDKKILRAIVDKFGGGPVGLDTLAASIDEEAGTLEDVAEPYLLQLGFIQRTPRGRMLTKLGYIHMGLAAPDGQLSLLE